MRNDVFKETEGPLVKVPVTSLEADVVNDNLCSLKLTVPDSTERRKGKALPSIPRFLFLITLPSPGIFYCERSDCQLFRVCCFALH